MSGDADTVTARTLWQQTSDTLSDRTRARWLCEVAVGLDGDEFLAALAEPVTERMVAHLDAMVARFRAGEPLAYVLGRWTFRHVDLAVDRRVLIPRPETELVAEVAIARARSVHDRHGEVTVVDLGTGSGAIGLAMADELPPTGTTVWLTELDADAAHVARANLAGRGRRAANVRVVEGSWFDALPESVIADVVVSNPPYVAPDDPDLDASVRDWEPHVALFADDGGLAAYVEIAAGAPARLRPDGWLVLEIGASQGPAVERLLTGSGYRDVGILPDLAGRDRIALGRRPPIG